MTFRGTWISNPTPLPRPEETWTWTYNPNLIGKDQLPNRSTDRPLPGVPSPIDQTWIQRHVQFTGKDTLPFNQNDWPTPAPFFRMEQTWVSSPKPIGTPLRQSDWPNPIPVQWYQSWTQQSLQVTNPKPFSQTDWPVPSSPYRIDQTQNRSSTYLFGQGIPANQLDWPTPQPVKWYQDWNNTPALNMPVFMPSVVSYWDIPPSVNWYQSWSTCLLQTTLASPPAVLPFNKYDWPITQSYRLDQTWTRNATYLLGRDVLPSRQQDWPTPNSVQWYQDYRVNLLQTTLFTTPPLPKIQQYDWPNPGTYAPLVPSWTYTSQFIVPSPVPTVTIGGQWTEPDADEVTAAYARAMEFALKLRQGKPLSINEAAAALAKRGGVARAKSLSSSQRSSIASHAASTRWKK